jgi:amylosucrase
MNLNLESKRSLSRIVKALDLSTLNRTEQSLFLKRLDESFPTLFGLLFDIYGHRYDYYFYLQELVNVMANNFVARSKKLKKKDKDRVSEPNWYLQENMLGMACYVDLFAGDLQTLKSKIPYLASLGITYLHLMPLYDSPKGDSDGGYAVSDYRKVNEKLGTNDDLKALADALADANISLILDFVFNHTSDEHPWALAAKQGDKEHQDFYYMFDDKTIPDLYERDLREIFPQVRRGNFTWDSDCNKWIWTTFNNFQWDLNYSNPAVFNAITDEMLYLANLGCEGLRLDALAFIWKDMGTDCENQPKAHSLIKAFNCCLKIAAPAVVFKSEAIVHPDEVLKYIDKDECQLSYNPLLMALIWNSLATRKTRLLTASMRESFSIPDDCAWVNYVRSHDDIGWTFDDGIAQHIGIQANDHRHFLNQFYTGRFEGSFATGVAFGENPSTGDCRVCGSLASLAGLEQALKHDDKELIQNAVGRILLVHAIILSIGGIPLLYSGDELGLLNDYGYTEDESKKHDGRWVSRIAITDKAVEISEDASKPQFEIAKGLEKLIKLRKNNPIFGQSETLIIETDNDHVFAYSRHDDEGNTMLALCNFSEHSQKVDSRILNHIGCRKCKDVISNSEYGIDKKYLRLSTYQVVWLTKI